MQNTIRTTIRIRKDLFNQTKLLALKQGMSLQETINTALAIGFGHVSDLDSQKQAMAKIDEFRKDLEGRKINLKKLLKLSRKDLK